jgi:hypothetical protein
MSTYFTIRDARVSGVITQNVDGLHQAAGSEGVVELHGSLDRVVCLSCRAISPRRELARRLEAENPGFDPVAAAQAYGSSWDDGENTFSAAGSDDDYAETEQI